MTNATLSAIAIGGALTTVPWWGERFFGQDVAFVYAPLTGVLISAPAFLVLSVAVRCQQCSYKLFWHALAKQKHPGGLGWFFQATTCPSCGYTREQ